MDTGHTSSFVSNVTEFAVMKLRKTVKVATVLTLPQLRFSVEMPFYFLSSR
jgi:hypothetical protein